MKALCRRGRTGPCRLAPWVPALCVLAAPTAVQAQPQEEEATVTVEMTDALTFEPAHVTIRPGRTVRWTNPSEVKHTVTADPALAIEPDHVRLPEGAKTFNSGPVGTGESWSHAFTVPGRYEYFCIPHELDGMVGTVVVEEAPGPAPSPEDAVGAEGTETPGLEEGAAARPPEAPPPETGEPAVGTEESAGEPPPERRRAAFVFGGHQAPRHLEVRRAEGLMAYVYWLGNFHPPAVSLPIGLLLGAALAELLLIGTGRSIFAAAGRFCLWAGGLGALVAGALGWLLAGFRIADGAWLLTTHRWLGTTAAALALLALVLGERATRGRGSRGSFRVILFLVAALVLAAGFFGGAMIYGLDHYALPG